MEEEGEGGGEKEEEMISLDGLFLIHLFLLLLDLLPFFLNFNYSFY